MAHAGIARRLMALLASLASLFVLAALLLASPRARAVDEADLLLVDQAFALSANAPQRDRIELSWKIAPGYYLYRHRISVQVAGNGFVASALELPDGQRHHDVYFGDVETYRGQLRAVLPGTAAAGAGVVTLTVKYQGCADVGVCYPPQVRTITVMLPGADGIGGPSGLPTVRTGGLQLPGVASPGGVDRQPLPEAAAFGFEAIVDGPGRLRMRFTPAPGYYLYRDRGSFRVDGGPGIAAGTPRWPRGTPHHDPHFGNVIVYFGQVEAMLPLQRPAGPASDIRLVATFQGCQVDGICYPPMTRTVALQLPATATATHLDVPAANATPAAPDDAAQPLAEDSRLVHALAGHGRFVALLLFFAAGLGLAFTPCVLPMVPILSGLIAGQGTRLGTGRALWLSFVYVFANALVFTAAGVVAGLAGANLQAAFQKPWILVAFAAVFVALALSSFGLYELQLPRALRSRLGLLGDRQRGGSMAGVAAMGALSALIVGPCVAPPLAAAVLYIGQSHDPVLGGAALFLLAMGMGAPLLVFGTAAGRGLPTSGPWMVGVQRVFGFLFLGLAVWMLARILPAAATLALWGLLALAAAAWASTAAPNSRRARAATRFAALVLAVAGAAELLGAFSGGSDPLRPLASLGNAHEADAPAFRTIKSSNDLDRELAAARAASRPVLFDFYADWCVSCKEMERNTFTDPAVRSALSGFVLLKADVTANDAVDQALMQRFGIIGPPGTLFFADGVEQRGLRLVGFEAAPEFASRLHRAAGPGP